MYFFFFQAEDGIRDIGVTGVQTCALPISLRELDLDRADRALGDALLQVLDREAPVAVAAAEVPGADLVDEVGAVQVRGREPTLARVVQARRERGAAVERLDGARRQRAVAHAAHVHHRLRAESVLA